MGTAVPDGERRTMFERIKSAWRLPARERIGADQLSAVVRATPAALACGVVNASLICASFLIAAPSLTVLLWFGSIVGISICFVRKTRASATREATSLSSRAMKRALVASSLLALPWGVASPLFIGHVSHANELLLITVLAGMSSGGSVLLAPVYPAAIAYMAAVLVPFALTCFALMETAYAFLGLVSISFGAFLLAVIATKARLSVQRTRALQEMTRLTQALKDRDALISTQNLRFETALNNMTQGLCFFDREERLIVCNRRYIDMYGLDPQRVRPGVPLREIVAMRYAAGACPDISQEDYLAWRSRAGNADRPSDTVWRLKNGRVFAIHYRPMADGAWVATTDDITERQQLAEQLTEQHKLLADRTALLQAIIDHFPGGIGFYDKDLRVVVCNDTAKAILDLPEYFFASGPPRLEDILRFNALRGEYGPGDPEEHVRAKLALIVNQGSYHFERSRPDGTVLDVRGAPVENIGFLTTYMDITERYRAEAKIAYLATHDTLTGLPNRLQFQQRLDEAVATARAGKQTVALLMLDLNRFKAVNDTLGHPVGDSFLKAVAERLTAAVRADDTVARLGGDEFAVVLLTSDAVAEAASVATRIQQALTEPFTLCEHTLCIGTSIGIAISSGDTVDAEKLIKQADMALYRAKAEGGNRYRFFDLTSTAPPAHATTAQQAHAA